MKYLILAISLLFVSCEKSYEVSKKVSGVITLKRHEDAKNVMEYHYGYSFIDGKYCYHFGSNHHPEKFTTIATVKNTNSITNSSEIYMRYEEGDTISMIETLRFREKDKKLLDTYYYFLN